MRRTALVLILGLAFAPTLGSRARADEKPVAESEVPKPALEAVKKKYPEAELVGFSKEDEDGKTTYEVRIRIAPKGAEGAKKDAWIRKIDIDLSPEGKILAEEEVIRADDLPDAVKKALAASKYASWTVRRVERVVTEERADDPSFEIAVAKGDEKGEVVLGKTGKITREEVRKVSPKKKDSDEDED